MASSVSDGGISSMIARQRLSSPSGRPARSISDSKRSRNLTNVQSKSATLFDLDRLLSRLERNILAETTADPALAQSAPLRRKAGANIEFARTLALRLEKEGSDGGNRSLSGTKARLRDDINDYKARADGAKLVIKKLNRRLVELDQSDVPLSPVADAREPSPDLPSSQFESAATTTTASLERRQRRTGNRDGPEAMPSTPHKSARQALFSTSTSTDPELTTAMTSGSKRETVLESNQMEQESLTDSLLDVAKQLKSSTRQFGALLDADREVTARAAKGLDRNVTGLEAADRKMGRLRKMTEGKGWLARMKLYAMLAAMWLAAFLLVFVGPKLRF